MKFYLNERKVETDLPPGTLVVDFLREVEGLNGTKAGCREGDCGACTVLLGRLEGRKLRYKTVNSCLLPIGAISRRHVVTIEGLNGENLTAVQQAIVDTGGTQCGFCTPGLVVALTAVLLNERSLDDESALEGVTGNVCRCTGYGGIKRAALKLVQTLPSLPEPGDERIAALVDLKILPPYFSEMQDRLSRMSRSRKDAAMKSGAIPIAGGTDRFVQEPRRLRDNPIAFLTDERFMGIVENDGFLSIGAAVTVGEMAESALTERFVPRFSHYARLIGSPQIRNRGTIGGNIANASPIGDLSIMLLALDARLVIGKGRSSRIVKLKDFFKGYKKTALKDGELIVRVEIPAPEPNRLFHFEKVSKRMHLDIASVNSAISFSIKDGTLNHVHLSAGGVSPIPLYLKNAAQSMNGKPLAWKTVYEAVASAEREIAPISDVRGGADYKRRLLKHLILAHFVELCGLEGEFR